MAELCLEVLDITPYTDETALKQTFLRVQPDAVVLKETPSLRPGAFLRDVPLETTLRVIVISLDKNALDVYEKQRVLPKQGRDLVALVRGQPTVSNSSVFS